MTTTLLTVTALALSNACLTAQEHAKPSPSQNENQFTAAVEVLAFGSRGKFLGTPDVRLFESEDRRDISGTFHAGVADHVPFGVYRIEASLSGFYAETRYVAIYEQHVTIVVGLRFSQELLVLPSPPQVRGRVTGRLPTGEKTFVKLTGVFSSASLESSIGADGSFDFGVPWEGRYLLLVVNEDGILASRVIDIPYTGPPIEIAIGPSGPRVR